MLRTPLSRALFAAVVAALATTIIAVANDEMNAVGFFGWWLFHFSIVFGGMLGSNSSACERQWLCRLFRRRAA